MSHLDASFGIEIECYLPEDTTSAQAAAALSQRGIPCRVEGYGHSTPTTWKIVTDGSLGDYTRGIEFVSPPLRGEAGLDQVAAVCRAITDFGCTVSKKCGLHVHVGVGAPSMAFFRQLVKLYAMFEPAIDQLMPPSRRASQSMFARSMTATSATAIDRADSVGALIEVIRLAAGAASHEVRYFKLNLKAFERHRTVEFRQHSGTVDARKTRMWVLTCLRLVEAAKRPDLNLGSAVRPVNRARPNTKAHRIGQMFLRPEGVTGGEVMAATGWPSVSMPQQARACGIEYTTQRTGREVRYFARVSTEMASVAPITVAGLAQTIGSADVERAYLLQRAADLAGPVAWAA